MIETNKYYIGNDGRLQECVEVLGSTIHSFTKLEKEGFRVLTLRDVLEQRVRAYHLGDEEVMKFWNTPTDTSSSVMYDLQNGTVKVVSHSRVLLDFGELKYKTIEQEGPLKNPKDKNEGRWKVFIEGVLERRLYDETIGSEILVDEFLQREPLRTSKLEEILRKEQELENARPENIPEGLITRLKHEKEQVKLMFEGVDLMDFFEGVRTNSFWRGILGGDIEVAHKYYSMMINSFIETFTSHPTFLTNQFSTQAWVKDKNPDYITEEFIHLDSAYNGPFPTSFDFVKFRDPTKYPLGHASPDISHETCRLIGIKKN